MPMIGGATPESWQQNGLYVGRGFLPEEMMVKKNLVLYIQNRFCRVPDMDKE